MRTLHRIIFSGCILSIFCLLAGCADQGIANFKKAVKYHQSGQSTLAEQQYKLALEKNPELAGAHLNLGLIYIENGLYDEAESSTRKAIEIYERTKGTFIRSSTWQQSLSLAYNNLGVIEMTRCKQAELSDDFATAKSHWKNGMIYFRKAIELDPLNSKAQSSIQAFENAY